jgi:hypothetical protein
MHGLTEGLGLGIGWIEVAADPLQPLGVLVVVRIGDRIEEVAVSPGAADILGRAASGGCDEARVGDAGHGISDALDADRVLPAVAEVVEI